MCGFYGTTLRYNSETYLKKLELMDIRCPDFQEVKNSATKNFTITLIYNSNF